MKSKNKLQTLMQQQLSTKLGVPKLDFLVKLTAKEMELLAFHLTNILKAQRTFGIKIGFTVAEAQAEKKGLTLSLPEPELIQIKKGNK